MAAAAVAVPWAELKRDLEKKATFEAACSRAANLIAEQPSTASAAPELPTLLRRARTLLRSRYSSPAYWARGRQLFQVAEAALGARRTGASVDESLAAELSEWVAEANEQLGVALNGSAAAGEQDHEARAPAGGQQHASFAFEGQLTAGAEPQPVQPSGLLETLLHLAQQQQQRDQQQQQQQELPAANQRGRAGQHVGGEHTQAPGHAADRTQVTQQADEEEGQAEQPGGVLAAALTPEMLERIEQELDTIAVELMEESGQDVPRPAPPASKSALRALPHETLTPARIAELGAQGERCPVCMEEYAEGDEVHILPCRHCFHPPCLAPWMEQHNSCPTCRFELPTDDVQYERRKEQRQVEEEERRGRENATNDGADFLYI